MNESFIHHVARVAIALGILIGLTAFALLLYAADFWSSPPQNLDDSEAPPVAASATLEPVDRDFGERSLIWMFGEPDASATPAAAAPTPSPEAPAPTLEALPETAPERAPETAPEATPETAPEISPAPETPATP